jgi:hypothetical protein
MRFKSTKLLTLLTITVLALLVLGGCGKFGSKFANQSPTIRITSYEGYDDSALLAPYANTEFLFQQKIYWHATDPDGIITGYAYRVKDQNGNPIATPGNDFIDMDGSLTPQNVINRFGLGWVIHYLPNANQDIPLDDPEARRTIWSSQKYAIINFPAADANGNPLTTESTFEVIAVDNRGDVTALDPNYVNEQRSVAWRKFKATSARPRCYITTTKGNPNGGSVGSGIRLNFSMKDYDPFIAETPYKYEFKMMKITTADSTVIAGTETGWFDSVTLSDPKINEYLLTRYTDPALTYDYENGNITRRTKIQARVYDLSGVVSTVSDSAAITFAVKPGFRPGTLIYPQKVYALGDNHYIDYTDESTPEILPFSIVGGAQRFATPFFRNMAGNYTAINSNNIKVWLRWGWNGEYGQVTATGTIVTNNPYDKKIDSVLDGTTNVNYFSEITNFDLRLDGEPYNYPPFANSIVTDSDTGKRWLRVPVNSPLGQTIVLTTVSSGTHTFEVRMVDLQGEVDPNPVNFVFELHELIPKADRSGILIIDDDKNNASTSPDATIQPKYVNMLSDYAGTKTFIKRTNSLEAGDTIADIRLRHLATTDLQQYALVIYHSDNPQESGSLKEENDGLTMYMKAGGNLLISHTSKLATVLDAFVIGTQRTFLGYFGINYVSQPVSILSDALQTRTFFQQAMGEDGYPNVDLQYGTTGQPGASFNPLVNTFQGLSTITYFSKNSLPSYNTTTTSPIYKMGIKPVGFTPGGPTEAQFTQYNMQPIGLHTVNANNHCFLFGFPLSYMQDDDTKALMNKVIADLQI